MSPTYLPEHVLWLDHCFALPTEQEALRSQSHFDKRIESGSRRRVH